MAEQNSAVLPRGVPQQAFQQAVDKFRALLGEDSVLLRNEQLVSYRKIMMPKPEEEFAPSAALTATTVEQIQGIVAICNEYKIPIWTVSTGHNFGYGTAAPHDRGQVILDLKRMNKIIEVDPVMCTALIEPGVTYQQLVDYIGERAISYGSIRRRHLRSSDPSATRLIGASATRPTRSISCSPAAWKSYWPTATYFARRWAASRVPIPGRSSNGVTDLISRAYLRSRTSVS
ncbi:FAD-binding oxidoreductase [Bradyrhizobium betae]|uniref:FAD-binding oxidoreductase n=1 Tax=Bradyrhizobium betae TaxID=244734 RepID=UPI001FCED3C6|nr:FAD-dependent oxidoreductase [Bradyrhizobium betae]MCS3731516.1 hypothetical protein [Bradyrhizobium betae]